MRRRRQSSTGTTATGHSSINNVRMRMMHYSGVISELKTREAQAARSITELNQQLDDHTHAKNILLVVAATIQRTAKKKIEALVTAAIRAVYDRPFRFVLNFRQQRGRVVAEPIIKEGDNEYSAKDDLGGGMVDIISFALRLAMWSMRPDRTRATMILDEPMKFIGTGELMERAAQFIKTVSTQLNIQFIILTHDHLLASIADKWWEVQHKRGKSKVIEG